MSTSANEQFPVGGEGYQLGLRKLFATLAEQALGRAPDAEHLAIEVGNTIVDGIIGLIRSEMDARGAPVLGAYLSELANTQNRLGADEVVFHPVAGAPRKFKGRPNAS